MKKKTLRDHIKDANGAHTDLCLFDTIKSMLEGGGFSSDSQTEQFAIIHICDRAMQKCLARHDRATARAGAPYQSKNT